MNYKEFTQTFLPSLAKEYREGNLPFHALIDFDLWRRVFPDQAAAPGQVQWYAVKLNAFCLNDEERTLLLTFSIPLLNRRDEVKFVGMRINNKQNTLTYYLLRRPRYNDELWDLFQYDFENNQEIFIQKNNGTDSLREFRNTIELLKNGDTEPVSLFDVIKKGLKEAISIKNALY